jgi:ornithine cyclodeaminase/alanine dehydrogenase-like protein (mu-crystallin family)
VRPIRQAYVVTRTGQNDAAFCAEMTAKLGIAVTPSRNPQQAVAAADVLCLATNSSTPVIASEWLKPGVHINAVGAYTAKMREVDSATVQRSRVFVDHHTAARVEAGDILIPLANGEISESQVAGALGELINGQVTGRTSPEQITFFKSVGLAVQDAVTVAKVYRLAVERNVGQQIDW